MRGFGVALVALVLTVGSLDPGAAAEARFTAALEDGTRIEGKEVGPWNETNSQPKLEGKPLLDEENPLRWLRDNSLPEATPPEAFVEFFGGDRIPGRVVGFATGEENPYDRRPPHLIFRPETPLDFPGIGRETLRFDVRWLRRIVWRPEGAESDEPGVAVFRDGRKVSFRSLRFGGEGVRLLTDEGLSQGEYARLAALNLPARDPWACYFEQLASLAPDGRTRLVQLATSTGLRMTGSAQRFAAKHHGSSRPDRWYHMLQPAWSLDPVWVPFREIRMRRYWSPERPPLSLAGFVAEPPPEEGSYWPPRRDRNVQGGPLGSGEREFGWGFGVHAPCRLTFPAPEIAVLLRTHVGLDHVAGRGGCVRAAVLAGGKELYRSGFLVGSHDAPEELSLTLPEGADELTLVADLAHHDRPDGADPLNIRDSLDWLEPQLELDTVRLRDEVRRRAVEQIAGLEGWRIEPKSEAPLELENAWDESDRERPAFRLQFRPRAPIVRLTRTLSVGEDDRWLALAVSRMPQETAPAKLQVTLDGETRLSFEPPERPSSGDPEALLVPLDAYRGREVLVELLPLPLGPRALLDWRGTLVVSHPPGLLPLFDEEPGFVELLSEGGAAVEFTGDSPHAGKRCLKISPEVQGAGRTAPRLPQLPVEICERPRLGQFRYLRFAWRKQGGLRVHLGLGHDGQFGPAALDSTVPRESFRYSGSSAPAPGAAIRLGGRPGDWVTHTRDLYADFGAFTLTGLSLDAVDGETAWFDAIYLARRPEDFRKIELLRNEH